MIEEQPTGDDRRRPGLAAVDVQAIGRDVLAWNRIADGIAVEELPVRMIEDPASLGDRAAVLSWRWDREANTGPSRNVALALKHAHETGVEYLFVDLVSIEQTLPLPLLLRSVVGLAHLYRSVPVIAAYDEARVSIEQWDRTLQRPWILSEVRAFCQNPTRVTYVGYHHGPDRRRPLSFANEVSVIRSTGYAGCVFDILSGHLEMTDVKDFALILEGFTDVISAFYSAFSRADYLMAVFLLTAKYERIHADPSTASSRYGFRLDTADPRFEHLGLERFTVGDHLPEVLNYGSVRPLLLDGAHVATWRSRMTSSFDRNWIEVLPEAEDRIFAAVKLPRAASKAYKERVGMWASFLNIDRDAPTPSIREHAADLTRECWLAQLPDPQGTTLGFNEQLWR